MRRDIIVAVLAIGALAAVSLLTTRTEEPKSATHASDDYGFGGYRAWYDLLAREGVTVERFRRHHDALPDSGIDTLIVAFPVIGIGGVGESWDVAERDWLRAWVRSGGRLVDIGLTPPAGKDDAKGESVFLVDANHGAGRLSGPWVPLLNDVARRGAMRLVAAKNKHPQTLLRDRSGALVVRYPYGRGEVIGVASAEPFENRALGTAGDARLAYLVGRPRAPGGVVAFDEAVRGDIVEKPWYRALTVPELVALAFAALAGLLWIAYGIVPLGPPVRLRAPREPTSEEFVDAVAALYQRARARDHAAEALLADARLALDRSAQTQENATLGQRIAAAVTEPLTTDAALVGVAQLARTAREEIIRAASPDRRFGTPSRGIGARRRRR